MSKEVAAAAIRASHEIVERVDKQLQTALEKHGADQQVRFPETAFYLPMACALLGAEVENLSQMQEVLDYTKTLLTEEPSAAVWLPYLSGTLDAGVATMLSEEMLMALRYLEGNRASRWLAWLHLRHCLT